ncbi:endonuclease/exonuclease/phosphatase family protein, partial [Flavitalea sp.]|nr:endonuclease/exonuclease/phosphatase family protein [Flavitalea sp.]
MNQLRIATYNLRYANDKDTGNLWVDRSPVVINLIRFHDFDILGTQEGVKAQLDDISTPLHYYQRFGVARDDGKEAGEHSAIFFKTEKFKLIKGGNFWLSEKPQSPGLGWDAKHNRLCTWVELEIKDNQEKIFVFNAHFDYHGVKAREESSRLVLENITEIAAGNKC